MDSRLSNLRRYRYAIGLAAITILWLWASRSDVHDRRMFWGLWRTPACLLALALSWMTLACIAAAHSRRSLFKVVTATCGMVLVLLLTELLGWILPGGIWPSANPHQLGTKQLISEVRSGETYQDTYTRWGIPSEPIPFLYQTDRRGFRHENDHEDPDIVLLGDSILVSALLPFKETVTGRLDATLDSSVANVALIGIGPQKQSTLLRKNLSNLEGKLVLQFVFEGNDLRDSAIYRAGKPPVKSGFKSRSFIWQTLMQLQKWTNPIDPVSFSHIGHIESRDYTFLWDRTSFEGYESEIPHLLKSLAGTRQFVEDSGGRYALIMVPAKIRVIGRLCTWSDRTAMVPLEEHLNPLPVALKRWAGKNQIPFLDFSQALISSAQSGTIPFFPGDTHLNRHGHAVMANSVLTWNEVLPDDVSKKK